MVPFYFSGIPEWGKHINHGNNNLSTVVLTEKMLCRNTPDKNKTAKTIHNGHPEYHDIKNPPIIVIITSTMATPKNRYL
jgi:hypothetical protein